MKKRLLAVVLAGLWMNLHEFIRNELVVKDVWMEGYRGLGLAYPAEPINAIVWVVWAFAFVAVLSWLVARLGVLRGALTAWFLGYVLLWAALGNLGVLPAGLLVWAVPWSFLEILSSAWIADRVQGVDRC